MEHIIDSSTRTTPRKKPLAEANVSGPAYQAYQVLHVAFVVAPIVVGLDKFFNILVNVAHLTCCRGAYFLATASFETTPCSHSCKSSTSLRLSQLSFSPAEESGLPVPLRDGFGRRRDRKEMMKRAA